MNNNVYKRVLKFKDKYPMTIAWRLKQNSMVVEQHLNPDEKVLYAFAGQKNNTPFNILGTGVVALTNKRIIIGRKRVAFGYFLDTITPDLFNDLKIVSSIIWGKLYIDTAKELVVISNLDKKSLVDIETIISSYMMEAKKKYDNEDEIKFDEK